MSKSNKFLMKLIEASGGWENFLYKTLKEVCTKVSLNGFTGEGEDSIEEAQEILEVYEDQKGEQAVDEFRTHNIKLTPTLETKDIVVPTKSAVPIIPPKLIEPRKLTAKVGVDTDAGWSQGQLPLPEGYRVVNKRRLTITTRNGMELGRGSEDGQVRGQGVSGHIGNDGKYRLVFKEVNLGVSLINFEILPVPVAPPAPKRPKNYVPMDPKLRDAALKEQVKAVPVDSPRPEDGIKEVG